MLVPHKYQRFERQVQFVRDFESEHHRRPTKDEYQAFNTKMRADIKTVASSIAMRAVETRHENDKLRRAGKCVSCGK